MCYPLFNLLKFLTACFAHYCVALGLALLWLLSGWKKRDAVLRVFAIGFAVSLAFHTMLHLRTSRYMLIPVLLALPIIACAAVALKDSCIRHVRFGRRIFILLLVAFILFSFLKFNRERHHKRDAVLMRTAEIIAEDFRSSDTGEAVLISNGDNAGIIFAHAGLRGKFFKPSVEQQSTPQNLKATMELICSKYPLIYLLKEHRRNRTRDLEGMLNYDLRLPHSYESEQIDRGRIDPDGRYGKYELFRIRSHHTAVRDRTRIARFTGTPARQLTGGEFSSGREMLLVADAKLGNHFLAEHPRQRLPECWDLDLANRRGADFSAWSFAYAPPAAPGGHGSLGFHAPDGGFALRSRQKLAARDCRLEIAAKLTQGCRLLAFVYVYGPDGAFLTTQPVGIFRSADAGEVLLTFPIRRDSLPEGAAFFAVGAIGWQGDLTLEKMDIAYDDGE